MQQLIDDHHVQLNRLRLAINTPISPVEARAVLFDRELNVIETLLATGETLAHLNYLLHRKEILMLTVWLATQPFKSLGLAIEPVANQMKNLSFGSIVALAVLWL